MTCNPPPDTILHRQAPSRHMNPGHLLVSGPSGEFLSTEPKLASRQLEAWKRYQSLPMPKRKDEDWRFANVGLLDLEPYQALLESDLDGGEKEEALRLAQNAVPHTASAVFLMMRSSPFSPCLKA
ncbi:MAG: hypothetical protein HC904_00345 [Blastochloris sp.]|nr:hypothetical protein [Blastochloris sp.]